MHLKNEKIKLFYIKERKKDSNTLPSRSSSPIFAKFILPGTVDSKILFHRLCIFYSAPREIPLLTADFQAFCSWEEPSHFH
jgi:hypothetical protein